MLVFGALIQVGALTRIRVRLGVMTCEKVKWTSTTSPLDFQNKVSQSFGLATFGSRVIF
jgi:hypothetical protein